MVKILVGDGRLVIKPFESHATVLDTYYLWTGMNGLELWKQGDKRGVLVDEHAVIARVSFTSDLAKACGITKTQRPEIVDVMAGFGVDGATLALLGAQVECWEILPGVALMAQDLLVRCGVEHVAVQCLNSWLALSENETDVVYLDPMFELTGRTALAGKRMQYLEKLAGTGAYRVAQWIEKAAPMARDRVVVKRHLRDQPTPAPDWQIIGKKVRFDIYRGQSGN